MPSEETLSSVKNVILIERATKYASALDRRMSLGARQHGKKMFSLIWAVSIFHIGTIQQGHPTDHFGGVTVNLIRNSDLILIKN